MTGVVDVAGSCPACGKESLMVGEGGRLTCRRLDCPRPTAADEILDDGLGRDHKVTLGEIGFTMLHPLIERLDDGLEGCQLHRWLTLQDETPMDPGTYRVEDRPERGWFWRPWTARPGAGE